MHYFRLINKINLNHNKNYTDLLNYGISCWIAKIIVIFHKVCAIMRNNIQFFIYILFYSNKKKRFSAIKNIL